MTSETRGRFKRWFWRPPRPHGETIADRQVSVLELFYDLVYVAVIGQAAGVERVGLADPLHVIEGSRHDAPHEPSRSKALHRSERAGMWWLARGS